MAGSIIGWFTLGKVLVREWVLFVEPGNMQYNDYVFARQSSLLAGALFMGLTVTALICLAATAACGRSGRPTSA